MWETIRFKLPKTQVKARSGKYQRTSSHPVQPDRKFSIIEYPIAGESASKLMEDHNTLVFIVNLQASKTQIKSAFQKRWNTQVKKVNTLVRPDGKKKAFIVLAQEGQAVELGSKVGLI